MESWLLIDVDGGACKFICCCCGLLWGWYGGTRHDKGWQAKASLEDIPTIPRWYITYLFLRRDIDHGAGKRGVYPYFIWAHAEAKLRTIGVYPCFKSVMRLQKRGISKHTKSTYDVTPSVLTEASQFVDLGILAINILNESGVLGTPNNNIQRPMDWYHWTSPDHVFCEATAVVMSAARSDQDYSYKTDFEIWRENQEFEHQNISMSRPPLELTTIGTNRTNVTT